MRCVAVVAVCSSATRQHRLDVDYRRPVDHLELIHQDWEPLDGRDAHPVQTDRVWPVGGPGAEQATSDPA